MDTQALLWINSFATPWLDTLMVGVTTFGDVATILAVTALITLYFVRQRKWRQAAFVLVSIMSVLVINSGLKLLFARQRPELWDLLVTETTYSFPSGHAALSMALALCALTLLRKRRKFGYVAMVAAFYVTAIGFSRMYLGVHYPTDIMAGWLVALTCVVMVAWLFKIVRRTHRPEQ